MAENLLQANFAPARKIEPEQVKPDPAAEYQKKAIENISGSMVFVERNILYWDGK